MCVLRGFAIPKCRKGGIFAAKFYKKYRCELKVVDNFGMRSISIHHEDTLHAPSVIINAEKPECAMTFHIVPVPIDEWDKVKAAGDDICNILTELRK